MKQLDYQTYNSKLKFLKDAMTDAKDRGDYNLECDIEEKIYELNSDFNEGIDMK